MTLGLTSLYSVNELIGALNIRLAQNNSLHFYFSGIHSLLRLKMKTPSHLLTLKQVGTTKNSRLQFTEDRPLAEFLQSLEA